MDLPNPGMAFSPFDILTAEEMNDLVENIEALAAGTGLNDGAVTPSKRSGGFFGLTHTFNNATGSQSITGIGFTPKALTIAGLSRTATAEMHNISGYAFYNGSNYIQGSTSVYSAATPVHRTRSSTTSAIAQSGSGTTNIFEASVTGFSSGTVTFNVVTSTADPGFRSYHILIFG